jgi:hypothetical protein
MASMGVLPAASLRSVVGAAFGVVAQLDDGHDVQDPVDAPVAGPAEVVTPLVARGRLDGCGAVPRRDVAGGGEAGDVGDVADEAGGAGGSDPVELVEFAAVA